MSYKLISHGLTLIVGSIVAYLISPLTFLVFLLIWIDAMLIAHIAGLKQIGFELVTLAGLIGGLALGPIGGFFFSLLGLPLILSVLNSMHYKTLFPIYPNLNFVAIAIAAGIAGALLSPTFFIIAVVIALLFRHIVGAVIDFVVSGGFTSLIFGIINILFSLGFIYFLRIIGLLGLIV